MDDKIEELLVKKLDEGLSDSEERELNVWLGESWEHAVIFKEMCVCGWIRVNHIILM